MRTAVDCGRRGSSPAVGNQGTRREIHTEAGRVARAYRLFVMRGCQRTVKSFCLGGLDSDTSAFCQRPKALSHLICFLKTGRTTPRHLRPRLISTTSFLFSPRFSPLRLPRSSSFSSAPTHSPNAFSRERKTRGRYHSILLLF